VLGVFGWCGEGPDGQLLPHWLGSMTHTQITHINYVLGVCMTLKHRGRLDY